VEPNKSKTRKRRAGARAAAGRHGQKSDHTNASYDEDGDRRRVVSSIAIYPGRDGDDEAILLHGCLIIRSTVDASGL
jgi:hypothetical protein